MHKSRTFRNTATPFAGPLLIGLIAASTPRSEATAAEARRPNILFMFTDDQPQGCMGCMGNRHIQTPNMQRLAAEGVLFTSAFVTTAICCSNRACILTGQHMEALRNQRPRVPDAAGRGCPPQSI